LVSTQACDSIATLVLKVSPLVSGSETQAICSSQLPYLWHGRSLTTAGTYTTTLTSSSGCDSLATLTLNVNLATNSNTNVTVCNGQLPYSWNGQQYSTAGTYTAKLQNASGCDSVATLVLNVAPVLSSTTTITVCASQLPYLWNGNSYTVAGTYNVTLKTVAGCDSVATLKLDVVSVLTSTEKVNRCVNQLPYTWNGQTYTAAGTYSVTLKSAAGCDSIAILQLNVQPLLTGTEIVTRCANQLPYTWNGQSYTAAGTYSVTLKSAAGCDSVATLILQLVPVVSGTETVSRCANQLPYAWNGNSYSAAGTYSVTLKSAAGCDSIATLILKILPVPISDTTIGICDRQLPFVWNGITYETAGTYTVTLTSNTGCDSLAVLNLLVNSYIIKAPENITICAQELPYTWNGNTYNAAGTYTKTLSSSTGCDTLATLNLTIWPLVSATLTGANSICVGDSTTITLNLTGVAPWTVIYSDGNKNDTLRNIPSSPYTFNVAPKQTTTYTLMSVSSVKCTNSNLNSSVTVNVKPTVSGVRYPDVTTQTNLPVQLQARNLGSLSKYLWSPGTGLNYTNIPNPIFRWNRSMDYVIEISGTNECKIIDSVRVRIETSIISSLHVPKAWTPNNDGANDKLTPLLVNIKELHYFIVFNRWGQKMFETHQKYEGWDGTWKGVQQVQDVYTWVVEGLGEDGVLHKFAGNSVLLR
ncbi:MAG: T9SS type B sorting domain-containing protein, partial [Candidatus Dadabacteria bacterium]